MKQVIITLLIILIQTKIQCVPTLTVEADLSSYYVAAKTTYTFIFTRSVSAGYTYNGDTFSIIFPLSIYNIAGPLSCTGVNNINIVQY